MNFSNRNPHSSLCAKLGGGLQGNGVLLFWQDAQLQDAATGLFEQSRDAMSVRQVPGNDPKINKLVFALGITPAYIGLAMNLFM